ncbi:MAG: dinitrogenase iron-molybdenum cofactor biosynthesis protein [Bacteroidetes bacterium]|nr:dinitrogenase iron-molybdenum cofactor biosynthesis protein [Bacteroidota bacterium]
MKIAVPITDNHVDGHFGHCDHFSVFTIEANNAKGEPEVITTPEGCGCRSNIAEILRQKGVSVMLAGNMGRGAWTKLSNQGIQVVRGCKGEAGAVVDAFLDGKIQDIDIPCEHNHHGSGHVCNRHH